MTCTCIKNIEDSMESRDDISKAVLQEVNIFNGKTFTNLSLSKNGKKKKDKTIVQHTYCPFCGTRY